MSADPPMKRTAFAQQSLDFVTLFSAKFHNTDVNGYRPQLRKPTDSTAGGKQALQQIFFESQREGEPMLTVGTVNVVTKTAKLRTFDCVETLFVRRFRGRPFLVHPAKYQAFFDAAMEFMKRQGMQVEVETRPPDVSRSSRPPASAVVTTNLILGMVAIAVLTATGTVLALYLTGRISF